jgi:hypothetical protein
LCCLLSVARFCCARVLYALTAEISVGTAGEAATGGQEDKCCAH